MDIVDFERRKQELENLKKNRIRNFFTILKARTELQEISKKIDNKKRLDEQEKNVHALKLKGLFFQGSVEEAEAAFRRHLPQMEALGCQKAVTYILDPDLKMVVFSRSGIEHAADEGEPLVSLSQLQEVAAWLDNHGVSHAPLLDLASIEKKLAALMSSCPHGAYMLHAHNKALTLSRVSPVGRVEHLPIDIQKELGCYTLIIDGKEVAATRIQFKKRLEQMGTPLRLK